MDDLEEKKILENANRRIQKTDQRTEQDSRNSNSEVGSGTQTIGRDLAALSGPVEQVGTLNQRVQENQSQSGASKKRSRSATRRPGESDSGPDDALSGPETTADPRVGGFARLEAEGDLPPRPAASFDSIDTILSNTPDISDFKLGKALGCTKTEAKKRRAEWLAKSPLPEPVPEKASPSFIREMKTLSKTEAEAIFEPLLEAIEADFQAIDQWLWARQEAKGIDHHQEPVWSDFDEEESKKLGKLLVKWGQKNAVVATGVRGIVELGDYVAVGSMFAPRFRRTVQIYKATKKERKSRYANFTRRENVSDRPESPD